MLKFNRSVHADLTGDLSPVISIHGGLILVLLALLVGVGCASAGCPTCADQSWSAEEKFEQMGNPDYVPNIPSGIAPQIARAKEWGFGSDQSNESDQTDETAEQPSLSGLSPPQKARAEMELTNNQAQEGGSTGPVDNAIFVSPGKVSRSDVVLDVSDLAGAAGTYVDGAIHIDYNEFLDEYKAPKPIQELAGILGGAGISSDDSMVIYGTCKPCGGVNIHPATFAYWVMKYLGHDKVKILDGGVEAWSAAGYEVQASPSTRPATVYTPRPRPEILASYDYVNSGAAQIVDARSFEEFAMDKVPGAVNLPYHDDLVNGRLKSATSLNEVFAKLNKEEPVVVYTNTGVWATIPWVAMTMVGFDARIYSWKDWYDHRPTLNLELLEARAEPNPSAPGPVNIYAVFGEGTMTPDPASETAEISNGAAEPGEATTLASQGQATDAAGAGADSDQIKLKTMGCVTCGGIEFLAGGTLSKNKASATQLAPSYGKTAGGDFTCQASVTDDEGLQVAAVDMTRVEDDEYVGTWSATEPGIYQVTIIASASGITRSFEDALVIEITGEAGTVEGTGFKKLG